MRGEIKDGYVEIIANETEDKHFASTLTAFLNSSDMREKFQQATKEFYENELRKLVYGDVFEDM